ncbi:hypothetical protein Tco_1087961 [Tanacetum coccineum]
MSFSKRSETAPVCYTKPLDSLKHRNDNFFWVDAFAFPFLVLWHNNKILKKDLNPTPTEFNAEVCEFLATHPAPFWKFSESFLCLVSISRYYELDDNVYSIFLADDDEEMDLFAFIRYADPTKVRIGEKKIEEGQDAGNNVTEEVAADGQVIPVDVGIVRIEDEVPATRLREDHSTFSDVGASTAGKSLAVLQDLLDSSTLAAEVGATAAVTVPFLLAERFVISSDYSHHSSANVADDEVTYIVWSSVPPPPVLTAVVATTTIVGATSVLVHELGTRPVHRSIFKDSDSPSTAEANVVGPSQPAGVEVSSDTFYVSQEMDSETLQQTYVPKWKVINNSALDDPKFNVGVAHQACFSTKVRLRYEHNYKERKKFKRKCQRQVDLLKEKDTEIANLKAQLSLKEAEAAEAIHLSSQVDAIKGTKAAQVDELNGLNERNSAFEEEKNALEHMRHLNLRMLLNVKASSFEAERDRPVGQVSLLERTCYGLRDEVSGWAVAGIDHGKAGRGLVDVVAYNPFAEANYIAVVNAFRVVDFPLLAQLDSVLPIPVSDHEVADTKARAEASSSPNIIFEQETLETSLENPAI